jgi:nicotinamidase-related amidase
MKNPLGSTPANRWRADANAVSTIRETRPAKPLAFAAKPQNLTVDAARSAMIVIDMQNDFCHPDGWLAHIGVDVTPARTPIGPLTKLLPALRKAGMPVIWVKWGNRPDLLNLSPSLLHVYKPTGEGVGLGDPLPKTKARVLQKDSWAAAVVDELNIGTRDIRVDKFRMSGFWDTPLDSILRNLRIDTLFFGGVNAD